MYVLSPLVVTSCVICRYITVAMEAIQSGREGSADEAEHGTQI